jgi:exonuclease VII small subunit
MHSKLLAVQDAKDNEYSSKMKRLQDRINNVENEKLRLEQVNFFN